MRRGAFHLNDDISNKSNILAYLKWAVKHNQSAFPMGVGAGGGTKAGIKSGGRGVRDMHPSFTTLKDHAAP